jgi:uncharacterized membrane protein YdjX (TVP38/TMEM64 family)
MTEQLDEIDGSPAGRGDRLGWRRPALLMAMALAVGLAFAFDLHHLVSIDSLQAHSTSLQEAVDDRPALTALGYVAGYAAFVALALPGAVIFTIAGGLLFGTWLGGLLAISGATAGAIVAFLAARTVVGQRLAGHVGPWFHRLEAGFRENAWSYLFVLRVLPLAPFVVVNVGAALLGVRLKTYVLATTLGILPGSFVYAGVGNGLGSVLAVDGTPDLQLMLEPGVLAPLVGLAILALLPVAYKKWQGRHRPA